tara:strand:+ start:213 stop:404 length:192 start_codon:yes stop_codon:yes gene_type:complete
MEKLTEQTLAVLLAQAGIVPREGDLDRFGKLIDTYMGTLKALHSVDLGDEEIAPTFHPERNTK